MLATYLWGNRARFSYLLIASAILLFTMLGVRDIWTQEHRWADIVFGMFYRQDFLHPYLGMNAYYDKPLLSYWLIVLFAKLSGHLTVWTLRLPSACAGLLSIWSIYRLGTLLKDKTLGLLAGWLLLTTFYFLFWARVSSADMLNMAGSLLAVVWYMARREKTDFLSYFGFFLIIALTALCKGLIGAIVPAIAVSVDLVMTQSIRKHLNGAMLGALLCSLVVYLAPFVASSYFDPTHYQESGLYLVYRENILRFFHPFDHQGPIYTYFIYLPIYLLPWTIFFIPAVIANLKQWVRQRSTSMLMWTTCCLFIFLTLSGSRRSYYVLPVVPFAILLTAEWLLVEGRRTTMISMMIIIVALTLWVGWDILPAQQDAKAGASAFTTLLQQDVNRIHPWQDWNIVMLDAESKLNFYLSLPPNTPHYSILKGDRSLQTAQHLAEAWPIIQHPPRHTIFITRQQYLPFLLDYFKNYKVITLSTSRSKNLPEPVAIVPPVF